MYKCVGAENLHACNCGGVVWGSSGLYCYICDVVMGWRVQWCVVQCSVVFCVVVCDVMWCSVYFVLWCDVVRCRVV